MSIKALDRGKDVVRNFRALLKKIQNTSKKGIGTNVNTRVLDSSVHFSAPRHEHDKGITISNDKIPNVARDIDVIPKARNGLSHEMVKRLNTTGRHASFKVHYGLGARLGRKDLVGRWTAKIEL